MANKDYYDILGVNKKSSEADIKKAYRKKAMEHHPDKNKGNKASEAKFKEVNEAYETLKDPKKRQQYDSFGSAGANFGGGGAQGFSGFEDMFSNAQRGNGGHSSQGFDFSDLFGDMMGGSTSRKTNSNPFSQQRTSAQPKKEVQILDVEKTYIIPIFDLILGTKLNIETVYGENLKLKIPEGTKPGTKFKIKEKGRKNEGKTGDMFVIVEAKMPKDIPEDVKKLLESIKYRL